MAALRTFIDLHPADSAASFASKYGQTISLKEVQTIGKRFASLLWSASAKLGTFRAVRVNFEDGETERFIKSSLLESWLLEVWYVLPVSTVSQSADREALFVEAYSRILCFIAAKESNALDLIDRCQQLLTSKRNQIKYCYRVKELGDYRVEILLSLLEPFPEWRQVYARVIDKKRDIEETVLFAEMLDMELENLIGTIKIKKGALCIGPKKSESGFIASIRYQSRGFSLPFIIPLEIFSVRP